MSDFLVSSCDCSTEKSLVPALDKAISILEYLEKQKKASLAQISKDLGIAKTSAYQILKVLCRRGYLDSCNDNTYKLSIKLFELGNKVLLDTDIRSEVHPFLYTLMNKLKQTCHLGIIQGFNGIYVSKELYQGSSIINSWVGKSFYLHSTALGRCLLAWKNQQNLEYILQNISFDKITKNTVCDINQFMDILRDTRTKGWAEEIEETRIGIRCIAVPIRDVTKNVIASVSVSGLSAEFIGETRLNIISQLVKTGTQISHSLGYIE